MRQYMQCRAGGTIIHKKVQQIFLEAGIAGGVEQLITFIV